MHTGEEDHAQSGWTTSIHGQVEDSVRMREDRDKWRSKSMVWPTLGLRKAKVQNRRERGVSL